MRHRSDLLDERVAAFTANLRQAEAGRARAVHRARVASRRLREILPVVGANARECKRALKRLRQVTRQLGRLRELDVSLQLLADRRRPAGGEGPGVRLLRHSLVEARQEALRDAERKGFGRKLRRTARHLERLAADRPRETPSRDRGWRRTLDARVANRTRALVAAMDEAGQEFVPERVHDVRIQLKKLRYAVELAEAAQGLPPSDVWRRLTTAQARLGRLHDRQVLLAWAEGLTLRRATGPRARRDLRALAADLEAQCRVLHASYLRARGALRGVCRRILSAGNPDGATSRAPRPADRLRQLRLA